MQPDKINVFLYGGIPICTKLTTSAFKAKAAVSFMEAAAKSYFPNTRL